MVLTHRTICRVIVLSFLLPVSWAWGGDWPTYRHDNGRSGVTEEALALPLNLAWEYQSTHAPAPAWPGPARADYMNSPGTPEDPRVIYDRVFQVVASDGLVYFGSSANDKVYCLDAASGQERWSFFTEGPVRLAPTLAAGKVYVGSDDGRVYCLDARQGTLLWRYFPTQAEHRICGNERMVSLWPVRTSVLVHNGNAIFCAGIFPSQGVYFVTLDAQTGMEKSKEEISVSSQGYLRIQEGKLYTPTGRGGPESVSDIAGGGGGGGQLTAPEAYPYAIIRAGATLFAGGDHKVAALSAEDQTELWNADIDGRAYGLTVADGKLIVSTDAGHIYCFTTNASSSPSIVRAKTDRTPYPTDALSELYAQAAERIIEQSGITQGYCLDLGCGEGRLALELAKRSDLQIIGAESDAQKVAVAREALDAAGLYGRVVVHQGSLDKLPYSKYLFNLIVSDQAVAAGRLPGNAEEVFRVLRPYGGKVLLGQPGGGANRLTRQMANQWLKNSSTDGWQVSQQQGIWLTRTRGALAGAGRWTHQYADAGNSSFSNDRLIQNPMKMQWFGKPGPREMFDRHSRTPAPLSANGRLYVRGDQRIYGVDAYNGTVLWDLSIPELQTRVNMPRDSGYMAADDDYMYVAAGNQCRRLQGQTGKCSFFYEIPEVKDKDAYDWGYLAYEGDLLFGSATRKGSFYDNGRGPWYDGAPGGAHYKVCSDHLFALDKETGAEKWVYDGLIVNATIAIGGGKVYFVENRNPALRGTDQGRLGEAAFWQDMYLVALDAQTGKKAWETFRRDLGAGETESAAEATAAPIGFVPGDVVFYVAYADDTVILASSPYTSYALYAFDAKNGDFLWQKESGYRPDGNTNHHGGHMQHPVIMENVVYQDPYDYNLRTGEKGSLLLTRDGHGCGSLSSAPGFLFGRGGSPRLYDLSLSGQSTALTQASRPGCWINIIPAGGLILVPEASSGCSCAHPVQTSFAFVSP